MASSPIKSRLVSGLRLIAEPQVNVPNVPRFVVGEAGAHGCPRFKPRLHARFALDRIAAPAFAAGVAFAIDHVGENGAA